MFGTQRQATQTRRLELAKVWECSECGGKDPKLPSSTKRAQTTCDGCGCERWHHEQQEGGKLGRCRGPYYSDKGCPKKCKAWTVNPLPRDERQEVCSEACARLRKTRLQKARRVVAKTGEDFETVAERLRAEQLAGLRASAATDAKVQKARARKAAAKKPAATRSTGKARPASRRKAGR